MFRDLIVEGDWWNAARGGGGEIFIGINGDFSDSWSGGRYLNMSNTYMIWNAKLQDINFSYRKHIIWNLLVLYISLS